VQNSLLIYISNFFRHNYYVFVVGCYINNTLML